ncbi:MAG: YegP family protein [Blastocatellia bacterium]
MAKFEIYQDAAGDFRWRFQANNGKVLAVSDEGYLNRANCEHAIILIKREAVLASVTDAAVAAATVRQ